MSIATTTATAQTMCSGSRLRKHRGRKRAVPCDKSSQNDVLTECSAGDDVYSLCTRCLPRLGRLPCGRNSETDGPTGELTAHGCSAATTQLIGRVKVFVAYMFTADRIYWTVGALMATRSLHFVTVAMMISFLQTMRHVSPQWMNSYSKVHLAFNHTIENVNGWRKRIFHSGSTARILLITFCAMAAAVMIVYGLRTRMPTEVVTTLPQSTKATLTKNIIKPLLRRMFRVGIPLSLAVATAAQGVTVYNKSVNFRRAVRAALVFGL